MTNIHTCRRKQFHCLIISVASNLQKWAIEQFCWRCLPSINNMQKIKGFPTFLWKYLNKTTISFKFLINLCSNYYLIFVYDSFLCPSPEIVRIYWIKEIFRQFDWLFVFIRQYVRYTNVLFVRRLNYNSRFYFKT